MTLDDKIKLYLSLLPKKQDEFGFILSDECDSLLFTGLIGSLPEVKVDIDSAFEKETGMWMRRPCCKPCYPEGSKSTISRDMLVGLAYYAWFKKRLDISEQVIKYALSHWLIMGKGDWARIWMSPGLLATYAEISYRLGGPNRWWLRYIPQIYSTSVGDYQAHLTMLHIALIRCLKGHKGYQSVAKTYYEKQPNNPLFALLAGDRDVAEEILMDETLWPAKRLPGGTDRKGPWLPERDHGPNWLPGTSEEEHTGADFLFCAFLLKQL